MLIRFSVENWMSFRDKASFSMIAGRERQHQDRVPYLPQYKARVLPVAAVYGGNASGKTNLFRALSFAKKFVVRGTQPDSRIPVESFALDTQSAGHPSRFSFELLVDEVIYDFSFSVTQKEVAQEKLVRIEKSREKVLYLRENGGIVFDKTLADDDFLKFAFQGTRDNQLFLTNSVSQKVQRFRPIYNWFKETLTLVAPDSRFGPFEQFLDEENPLYANMNKLLPQLDTGISRIGGEEVAFEAISFPDEAVPILEGIPEGQTVNFIADPSDERLVVTRKNGRLAAKKLVTHHNMVDGEEVRFDMRQESDGTRRVIDLLPAFLGLASSRSGAVFVIDEIDRSLHTLLTRQLIQAYLDTCSSTTRSQLLFTTHDVLLMDQQLLRRDEMWVAERDGSGVSQIMSFSEYSDVRYDKDIRKSYLQGRLGGVPRIRILGLTDDRCPAPERGGAG